jgi:hypothetical protein
MKLDFVVTCGSSTQNTRSKSIHPDVKRILSSHLKKNPIQKRNTGIIVYKNIKNSYKNQEFK